MLNIEYNEIMRLKNESKILSTLSRDLSSFALHKSFMKCYFDAYGVCGKKTLKKQRKGQSKLGTSG